MVLTSSVFQPDRLLSPPTCDGELERLSHLAYTQAGPIEYTLSGRGGACLILHGGHGNCFSPFGSEEAFRAGLRVLIPSRPGYGRTPAEVGESADEAADALVALLDTLSIPEVSLVALSAAGPTGLSLAARYPERVQKLVLESAVTKRWQQPTDPAYRSARRIFNPSAEKFVWAALRRLWRLAPDTVLSTMIPSFSTRSKAAVLAQLGPAERAAFGKMLQTMASGAGFMLDLEHDVLPETLAKVRAPTLIVHSPYDGAVPFTHAEHAYRHIPGAALLEAPTWGHLIWLGGEAVLAEVTAFLEG